MAIGRVGEVSFVFELIQGGFTVLWWEIGKHYSPRVGRWLRGFRRPKDRWPAWRPDQILTPENRTMIIPNKRRTDFDD